MKKIMTAAFALSALFVASGRVHADVNYPWCIIGNTRAVDCYFSSREQCAQDGRNRGFGGQCIQNPFYKPGKPTVSGEKRTETARPSQAVSGGGAPIRNGEGQCFTYSVAGEWGRDRRFGSWGPCPQPAGTSKTTAAAPRQQTTRPPQAVSATPAPFGTIAGPQQRECKTVYGGSPVAEVCDGRSSPPCWRAWRVECSK
jgi:hypothetical protein